ncbi:hypothetical protein B0H63DRAFT_394255 [Podospora didyma]|uniref:Nucleotide-diphospho-sugar transferase domain-containing protein n=1 Tax=Podospora didyma TaxID=330526 RepID=A0AAE0U0A9_9PEZI|nr:hypothetical protein B0H63DRAFT_394255 [Podospora didyma]
MPTIVVLIFVLSALHTGNLAGPLHAIKDKAQSVTGIGSVPGNPPPNVQEPTRKTTPFGELLFDLWAPIKVPANAKSYTDQRGEVWTNNGNTHWTHGMGKGVLIIELDTRNPIGTNEIFNPDKLNWETMSSLLSVSHMNHFMYSQIHGYDYKFFNARHMEGHHDTWIKPHVLMDMLWFYRFVVFIDADAIIQHLELPIEFLFNRWNITDRTSIAMPIDTEQINEQSGEAMTRDQKGKLLLNSGVVVVQNLPHTFDMLTAWKDCTNGKRYPGCGHWKENWSHEQRAFAEYIRYDYNPDGNNIVEIPCNEAMGYPGLKGKVGVIADCKGEFIRHHTIDKNMAKTSTGDAVMQSMGELIQKNFARNKEDLFIEETQKLPRRSPNALD